MRDRCRGFAYAPGRLERAAVATAVTAASLALSAAGPVAGATTPPVQVEPTQLLLPQPVTALAADGPNVAFVFCGQSVGVWKPGAHDVTQLDGFAKVGWDCPSNPALRGPPEGFVGGVALAGQHLAWLLSTGAMSIDEYLGLADIRQPAEALLTGHMEHINDPGGSVRFGGLVGHGRMLVFSSSLDCSDPGAPPCPAGAGLPTLVSQTAWLVQPGSTNADCLGQSGPCQSLVSADASLVPLATNGSVVLVREASALAVVDRTGRTVRRFPALAAASSAVLTADSLVAIAAGRLLEESLTSEKRLHSWPLAHAAAARLLDSGHGLVAYLAAGKLHLLRLGDGRDRVVAAASNARFGANGLFYTHTATGPWPGRITFSPWRALPLRQATTSAQGKAKPKKPKPKKKAKAPKPKPTPGEAIAPGTYSGTVQMTGVTIGATTYQTTLTGNWTLTVDTHDHATGSEHLQATIPFATLHPTDPCTYSPTSWTLGFNAGLGTDITLFPGTPGNVQGTQLLISLSNTQDNGWSGSPDQYTRSCPPVPSVDTSQWPILVEYESGGSTGAPVYENVKFPVSFFKTPGQQYSIDVSTILKHRFTQTYTLASFRKP